jgi:hypothetical protein
MNELFAPAPKNKKRLRWAWHASSFEFQELHFYGDRKAYFKDFIASLPSTMLWMNENVLACTSHLWDCHYKFVVDDTTTIGYYFHWDISSRVMFESFLFGILKGLAYQTDPFVICCWTV